MYNGIVYKNALFLLTCILLLPSLNSSFFIGLAVAVSKKRSHRQNNKGQNSDHCSDIIVLFINGKLIEPGNKQVCFSGCGRQIRNRISSRKKINNN